MEPSDKEYYAEDTAHLIDNEPVMILGCSNYEIMVLAGIGFLSSLLLGLFIFVPLDFGLVAVPIAILTSLGTVYFGGKKLGKAKEGKPNGFFNRALRMKMAKMGLNNSFVRRSGFWRIRR